VPETDFILPAPPRQPAKCENFLIKLGKLRKKKIAAVIWLFGGRKFFHVLFAI
jgi:hypothetical protein